MSSPTDLTRLHDIVPPPPAPLWPPAPGALLVLVLAAAALLILSTRAFIRWQRNRYRREALAELKRIMDRVARASSPCGSGGTDFQPVSSEHGQDARATHPAAAIATLLKRTALTAYPRTAVASLTGPAWHAFLDRAAGTTDFATLGPLLDRATYTPQLPLTAAEKNTLTATARHWIKKHKTTPSPYRTDR